MFIGTLFPQFNYTPLGILAKSENIGEVKILSQCKEQSTTGQWRKTYHFLSFYYPDIIRQQKRLGDLPLALFFTQKRKEGLISQSLLVYNLLRKVVGAENSDLPSVKY